MIESLAALSIVLGAIFVLRFVLAGLGVGPFGRCPGARVRVVESVALGAKQQIHLIEVDGRGILVGATEQGISRLARLPQATPAEAEAEAAREENAAPEAGGRANGLRVLPSPALFGLIVGVGVVFGAGEVFAQAATPGPSLTLSIDGGTAPDQLSDTLKIVLLLTAVSVAPSFLLMATCFTRILIVLALLRQALGTATLPPNQVLVGLALMTTVYVMAPVGELVYAESITPYMAQEISGEEALERGLAPVRDYLLSHTREDDLQLFLEMKGGALPETLDDVAFPVLMPAFMISELRASFEIGFMIYLPFLVVDLVIASMLISLGMIMLPPVMIALPFKLMLFVLVDGWNLTLSALVTGLQ